MRSIQHDDEPTKSSYSKFNEQIPDPKLPGPSAPDVGWYSNVGPEGNG
jgi:hypothetical protein